MINAKLIVIGGAEETEVTLKKLPATIGRSREATITLPHGLVSRQHCEIFEEQGILYVRDLNSLNGTYLNNEKIAGSRPLLPNQLLTLGAVTFRAKYDVSHVNIDDLPLDAEGYDGWTDDTQKCETIEVGSLDSPTDSPIPNQFRELEEVFDGVIDDQQPARNPSICLSAIEKLPDQHAATVNSEINIDSDDSTIQIDADQFKLSVDEGEPEIVAPDQSSLGSFIRKLPK